MLSQTSSEPGHWGAAAAAALPRLVPRLGQRLGRVWCAYVDALEGRAAWIGWWPTLVGALVLAVALGRKVVDVGPPGGGVSVQFATHPQEATYQLALLGELGRAHLRFAVHWDFVFMFAYGALLLAAVVLTVRSWPRGAFERRFGMHVAGVVPFAVLCDGLENLLLLAELGAFPEIGGVVSLSVALCATLKFSGVFAALTCLVLSAFWTWRRRLIALPLVQQPRQRKWLRRVAVSAGVCVVVVALYCLFGLTSGVGVGVAAALLLGVGLTVGVSAVPTRPVEVAPEAVPPSERATPVAGEVEARLPTVNSGGEGLVAESAVVRATVRATPSRAVLGPDPASMVLIPAGVFRFGSPADEPGRYGNEGPIEGVAVAAFEMARYPTTRGRWRAVMKREPASWQGGPPTDSNLPANDVSWFDAVEFCNALSKSEDLNECYVLTRDGDRITAVTWDRTANGYRLPTEAEWEYAARARTTMRFPWGDDEAGLDAHAWWGGNSRGVVHEVGGKAPNAWGLHDVIGNVWEWCWDEYANTADPQGRDGAARAGSARVLRGGSFIGSDPRNLRSAYRVRDLPTFSDERFGFRCVRAAHPQRPLPV